MTDARTNFSPFVSIQFSGDRLKASQDFREVTQSIYEMLESLPPSRERSLAMTKVEEAHMWTNKAIRFWELDEQMKTDPA